MNNISGGKQVIYRQVLSFRLKPSTRRFPQKRQSMSLARKKWLAVTGRTENKTSRNNDTNTEVVGRTESMHAAAH